MDAMYNDGNYEQLVMDDYARNGGSLVSFNWRSYHVAPWRSYPHSDTWGLPEILQNLSTVFVDEPADKSHLQHWLLITPRRNAAMRGNTGALGLLNAETEPM